MRAVVVETEAEDGKSQKGGGGGGGKQDSLS